ncbi:hypothetical protein AB0B25_07865 [Nocardia sp. NPDC049190]|uniref:hypothetical protein n=1 Tax=Nocardia sp. NPDC049190 TaxID=3155650 RepID=UPI0033D99907
MSAIAEPIPLTQHSYVEPVDHGSDGSAYSGPVDSGSSFSGPGFSGSSTSGSSGSLNTGSQDEAQGSGSVESAVGGFFGRIIRGVVTGS